MAEGESGLRDAWVTHSGLFQMATLIRNEVQRVLQGESSNLEERVFIMNLRTLSTSSHFFLPDPTCPMCSSLPNDTAELAQISLQSSLKINGRLSQSFNGRIKNGASQRFPRFSYRAHEW